jgi:hypothetical protein
MKFNYKLFAFTLLLVIVTTLSKLFFSTRLSWSGFSPVIAIALFAGIMVKDKSASFLLPLASLFISDLIIEVLFRFKLFPFEGLYKYQLLNYSILLIATLLGWALKGRNFTRIAVGALAAPTLFFLLSNFSIWVTSSETGIGVNYTKDFSGLVTCLAAGLPFYGHSLSATIIFLPVFLFSYNYITKKKTGLLLA